MEVAAATAIALAITIACLFLLSPLAAVLTGALAALMALITLTDFKHFIIPNEFSLPAIPLGVVANVMVFNADDWVAGLTESVLGVILAAGSFFLLRAVWYRWRGVDGLGMGDVKLAGVAGASASRTGLSRRCPWRPRRRRDHDADPRAADSAVRSHTLWLLHRAGHPPVLDVADFRGRSILVMIATLN